MVVDETGGLHGVRDHNVLLSLEHSPGQNVFGKELYPTIFSKAAVYIRAIITNHPFLDGNKRTGMASAAVFLENNGYKIIVPLGGVEKFALRVIHEKMEIAAIADWLKNNSKKFKKAKKA